MRSEDGTEIVPVVGVHLVGHPVQQRRVFVEVMPRGIRDVVRKTFQGVTYVGRPVQDASGYESMDVAIVGVELVAARLLEQVKPENLFFFFGKRVEDFEHATTELPFLAPALEGQDTLPGHPHDEQAATGEEGCPEPCAAILCKLKETEAGEKSLAAEQEHGAGGCYRRKVSWAEFQQLKQRLRLEKAPPENLVNHANTGGSR